MKSSVFLLLLLTACGSFAKDVGDRVSDQDSYRKVAGEVNDGARVWIARPQNLQWTEWKIQSVKGDLRLDLVKMIKSARYDPLAGNRSLLDLSLEDQEKRGAGLLIMEDPVEGYLAFRADATRVNPASLRMVVINRFDPAGQKLKWSPPEATRHVLHGVVVDREVKKIFVNP